MLAPVADIIHDEFVYRRISPPPAENNDILGLQGKQGGRSDSMIPCLVQSPPPFESLRCGPLRTKAVQVAGDAGEQRVCSGCSQPG